VRWTIGDEVVATVEVESEPLVEVEVGRVCGLQIAEPSFSVGACEDPLYQSAT
jgi:hypothetical protein